MLCIPICYTKVPSSLYPECDQEATPSDLLVLIELWLLLISLVVFWSPSRKLKVLSPSHLDTAAAQLLNQKSRLIPHDQ